MSKEGQQVSKAYDVIQESSDLEFLEQEEQPSQLKRDLDQALSRYLDEMEHVVGVMPGQLCLHFLLVIETLFGVESMEKVAKQM